MQEKGSGWLELLAHWKCGCSRFEVIKVASEEEANQNRNYFHQLGEGAFMASVETLWKCHIASVDR